MKLRNSLTPPEVIQVNQRTPSDCMVACLQMVTGHQYENLVSLIEHYNDRVPCTPQTSVKILRSLGFNHARRVLDFFISDVVILSVPSLNLEGKTHAVVWDGRIQKLFDPNFEKPGKKFYYPFDIPPGWGYGVLVHRHPEDEDGISIKIGKY